MTVWPKVVGFLLIGYLALGRSFAYLGVPPLFIGELVLASFLLLKPRVLLGTWTASILRPSPLNEFGLAMLVFMAYGLWQLGRGILGGSSVTFTLKFFVFNYYTLYIFLGLWIALHAPGFLPRAVRLLGWINGIYGLVYILALRYVDTLIPGSNVPLFSPPAGQVIVVLGLLCFERNLRAVWPILLLNIVVTLVWQVRAEWLGLGLGIIAWGFLTGRLGRVTALGVAGLALIGLIELAGINLPGRNGEAMSLAENLARIIAPIDLELAKQFSPNAAYHAGTAEWRELWWEQIWISAHSTPMLEAFGHGYGFDLFGLAPPEVRAGQGELRTPHNLFFFCLGYMGWVGVVLVAWLQVTIIRLLWRSYALAGDPSGLVFWVMAMARAFFEEGFETPFKAIPFYLLWGMAMAPGLAASRLPRTRLAAAAARPVPARP